MINYLSIYQTFKSFYFFFKNLFILIFFFKVESSNIRIHDFIESLINRDSLERNFVNLRLLSICCDDHCLGNNDDKNKNKSKHENKDRNIMIENHDHNSNNNNNNINNSSSNNNDNNNSSNNNNENRTINDSNNHDSRKLRWVRCLVVIEKQCRNENIHLMDTDETDYLMDMKENKPDSLHIHKLNKFETHNKDKMYNNPRCLPSILNPQNNNNNNKNNNNNNNGKIKNDNDNNDGLETSFDNFNFPGFQKEVFSAAWRGGNNFFFKTNLLSLNKIFLFSFFFVKILFSFFNKNPISPIEYLF